MTTPAMMGMNRLSSILVLKIRRVMDSVSRAMVDPATVDRRGTKGMVTMMLMSMAAMRPSIIRKSVLRGFFILPNPAPTR